MESLIDSFRKILESWWRATLDESIELRFVKSGYVICGVTLALEDHDNDGKVQFCSCSWRRAWGKAFMGSKGSIFLKPSVERGELWESLHFQYI